MNVAKLIFIGGESLHYSEDEIMAMTMRKFYLIYDEYLKFHKLKNTDNEDLLDLI